MTILLTGATGYLGGRIGRALLAQGHRLIAVHLNRGENFSCSEEHEPRVVRLYLSETDIGAAFERERIDGIVHTATVYGRGQEELASIIKANVEFPVRVLSLAKAYGASFFINTDSILNRAVSPYALSKGQFIDWLELFSRDMLTISMKLDHFYGPGERTTKFVGRILHDLRAEVPRIPLTVGTQTRDFIFVDDVVAAYMCVVAQLKDLHVGRLHVFEVGTGVRTTIKSLVTTAKALTASSSELGFGDVPLREHEMLDYTIDSSALRSLGWAPVVMVEEGLKRCLVNEV